MSVLHTRSTGDSTIDACISYSKALSTDIVELNSQLYKEHPISSEQLRNEYAAIHDRLQTFTTKLKPAALQRCNQMLYEHAAPIKNTLDSFTNALKIKHRQFLQQIVDLFHENKIQFPLPPLQSCWCSRSRSFCVENGGWIATGCAGAVALVALTSLGEQIGPFLAESLKYFGGKCSDVGDFFVKLFASKQFKQSLSSPWVNTTGKIALCAAAIYPTYWYLKKPFMKTGCLFEKFDRTITSASKHPTRTLLASWAIFYFSSQWFGFEGKFAEKWVDPSRTKLFLTLSPATLVPVFVDSTKGYLDEYKRQSANKPLPTITLPVQTPPSANQPVVNSTPPLQPPKPLPTPQLKTPFLNRLVNTDGLDALPL